METAIRLKPLTNSTTQQTTVTTHPTRSSQEEHDNGKSQTRPPEPKTA